MMAKPWKDIGRYGTVGIELVISMMAGFFLGQYLDKKFGTSWISIVGLGLGVYAGFRQLWRTAQKMTRDAERAERIEEGEEPWQKEYLEMVDPPGGEGTPQEGSEKKVVAPDTKKPQNPGKDGPENQSD